ncbi:XkdF-like putative serine protease domain-containing protein [Dysgonomonas sp. 520]|uniref:XkdF-like putative serine protease domain-containing protein n=1 Tax=Dysgonomonas sp. 520 TaxID=2302931 RepID=UPI0013D826AB|nr:XkdF-like putative serine protease domain-containing protein [Dysgonomonas sp. 520]NDW10064.1 hypothetical protein [Dysgonomonas sp. 520]
MNKDIPIYKCVIDESDNETGIYAISFVDFPAVEVDFVALSKQKKEQKLHLNQDKQILTGVVLQPEQLIYRYDDNSKYEYYITYSAEQIEKIAQKMMRSQIALTNTTHQHQAPLTGNYLVELWIIQDPDNDKANALGFQRLPKGTLMCSYKVSDSKYWNKEVKTGNVKGFSLEGMFYQEKLRKTKSDLSINQKVRKNNSIKNNTYTMNKNTNKNLLSKIGRFFLDIEDVEIADAADAGETVRIFTLKDGSEITVDEDGYATIDGEQMSAGEHILSDDSIIEIDADGYLVETKETDDVADEPEEAVAPTELKKSKRVKQEDEFVEDETFEIDIDGTMHPVTKEVADYVASLLAKIAELESTVADDAVELRKLRKSTPSTKPANVRQSTKKIDYTKMSRAEKLAYQLSAFQKK